MTIELQMLVWVALLSILQALPYTLALILNVGLIRAMSYPQPDQAEVLPEWAKRSKRAHLNLVENIAPFAIVVIAANLAGVSTASTVLGAEIFFWARVAMLVGHTGGIMGLRTVSWFASLAGVAMIVLEIL